MGGIEIGRLKKKKVNISLFDTVLALKRADCCVLVLCLVLGGVADLLDDLLQPPGQGLDQGPQGFTVLHSNFSRSALYGRINVTPKR